MGRVPDGPEAKSDALIRTEADGGASQAAGGCMHAAGLHPSGVALAATC